MLLEMNKNVTCNPIQFDQTDRYVLNIAFCLKFRILKDNQIKSNILV